jgi:hypothetical protein
MTRARERLLEVRGPHLSEQYEAWLVGPQDVEGRVLPAGVRLQGSRLLAVEGCRQAQGQPRHGRQSGRKEGRGRGGGDHLHHHQNRVRRNLGPSQGVGQRAEPTE